ncbi:MAG TPA: BTAD domain-containing putative transcriptional regulator [Acidimicrobiales bacterium]|nr:BTAD domain-containing putative transcriptional regulator [Acidimicrobiales bacterium]
MERFFSAAGLLLLVAGVPAVLVGSHVVPSVHDLRAITHPASWPNSLSRPLDDDVVVQVVGLIAWLVWLWLAICFGAELVANLRGRPTVRIPGSRHGQSLAAFLVGTSLALFPSARVAVPLRFQAVEAAASRPLRPTPLGGPLSSVPEFGSAATAVTTSAETALQTYTVQPGDTLWSIASRELGSPLAWRELAQLNMGRPQPDGRELTDAHWIFPGWLLLLPPAPASDTPSEPSAPSMQNAVASAPAQAPTQAAPPAAPVATPTPPAPAPAEPSPAPSPASGSASANGHAVGIGERPHVPIVPIGYGVVGAAVVGVVDRMRRAQQRRRGKGLRIALPEGELVELERGLRIGADQDAVEWIDLGQRLLSSRAIPGPGQTLPPRIVAARLCDEALELLLDPACSGSQPPEPFETSPDGFTWILRRDAAFLQRMRSDPHVSGAEAPLPALVTLGRDERGLLLVDVERAGSISASGAEAEGLVEAMAVEMACSKWSDQVDLVLVGLADSVEALERISVAPSVASVVQKVERRVRERRELLDIVRRATNFESRWLEGGDAWDLCVVICMRAAAMSEPQAVDELIRLAGDGSCGLAVVCASETSIARTRVRVDLGPIDFELGMAELSELDRSAVWPQRVESGFAEKVGALVDVASRGEGVSPRTPPYDRFTIDPPPAPSGSRVARPGSISDEDEAPPGTDLGADAGTHPGTGTPHDTPPDTASRSVPEVEVRVLGPIEIVGAAPFNRAWSVELVVYLAMHRPGATTDAWSTALWPDRLMAPASLHSTASAARRALGISRAGQDHLPRSHGRLALGPGVTTDFEQLLALSRSVDPSDWERALALVRGRPFEGLRAPDWALLEGITANIEAVVVDLACRYSELCLSTGDAAGAQFGARQALRVSPYDERLFRILMRAADLNGNPAGVISVMEELTRLVADDIEPFDSVHPETLELYRALARRPLSRRGR